MTITLNKILFTNEILLDMVQSLEIKLKRINWIHVMNFGFMNAIASRLQTEKP